MIHRDYLENFLRLQEIPITEHDDIIRDAFFRARWQMDDIDRALLTLRDEAPDPYLFSPADFLMHTDVPISPQTLSSLLGIDVNLQHQHIQDLYSRPRYVQPKTDWPLAMLSAFIGACLALSVSYFIMYQAGIGPFFTPVAQFTI